MWSLIGYPPMNRFGLVGSSSRSIMPALCARAAGTTLTPAVIDDKLTAKSALAEIAKSWLSISVDGTATYFSRCSWRFLNNACVTFCCSAARYCLHISLLRAMTCFWKATAFSFLNTLSGLLEWVRVDQPRHSAAIVVAALCRDRSTRFCQRAVLATHVVTSLLAISFTTRRASCVLFKRTASSSSFLRSVSVETRQSTHWRSSFCVLACTALCGEHFEHTTSRQLRQWCRRWTKEKLLSQHAQADASASGCHLPPYLALRSRAWENALDLQSMLVVQSWRATMFWAEKLKFQLSWLFWTPVMGDQAVFSCDLIRDFRMC